MKKHLCPSLYQSPSRSLWAFAAVGVGACGSPQNENSKLTPASELVPTYEVRAEDGRDIVAQARFHAGNQPNKGAPALRLEGNNSVKLNDTPMRIPDDLSECLAAAEVCYQLRTPANEQNLIQSFMFDFGSASGMHQMQKLQIPRAVQLVYSGTPIGAGSAPNIVVNVNGPVHVSWVPFEASTADQLFVVFRSGKSVVRFPVPAAAAAAGSIEISALQLQKLDVSELGGFLQFEREQQQENVHLTVVSKELPTDFVRNAL